MSRPYESMISLKAGMVLMFLGFFVHLGGESEVISAGYALPARHLSFLEFFLVRLTHEAAIYT